MNLIPIVPDQGNHNEMKWKSLGVLLNTKMSIFFISAMIFRCYQIFPNSTKGAENQKKLGSTTYLNGLNKTLFVEVKVKIFENTTKNRMWQLNPIMHSFSAISSSFNRIQISHHCTVIDIYWYKSRLPTMHCNLAVSSFGLEVNKQWQIIIS